MTNHTLARAVTAACIALPLALFGCGGGSSSQPNDTQQEQTSSNANSSETQGSASSSESGEKTAMSEDGRLDLLTLVNKENKLPEGWEDKLDLVKVSNSKGDTMEIDTIAEKAFEELQEDLKTNEGIDVEVNSAYRSVEDQQDIWNMYMEQFGGDEEQVSSYVLTPGYSEHHTGLALDVLLVKDGVPVEEPNDVLNTDYKDTWDIVHSHLADHGFILRYPSGKEDETGIDFESWHIRYVGPEAAKEIMDKGITLEEYLGKLPSNSSGIDDDEDSSSYTSANSEEETGSYSSSSDSDE